MSGILKIVHEGESQDFDFTPICLNNLGALPANGCGMKNGRFKEWIAEQYRNNDGYRARIQTVAKRIKSGENIQLICCSDVDSIDECCGHFIKEMIEWLLFQNKV